MSYSDPLPNMSESDNDNNSVGGGNSSSDDELIVTRSRGKRTTLKDHNPCIKLMLPDYLAAYMEERDLEKDVEPIQCSEDIVEKIFGNYLIVKNILSHLRWQDKLICKDVCPLWASAVNRLQLEQLGPVDFSINAGFHATREGVVLLKSSEFYTEPMAVFTFCSAMGLRIGSVACETIASCPCMPPCDVDHCNLIHQETTAPRDCMYIVKACSMSYMPLPHSLTMENIIKKPVQGCDATFYGMYIPKIPGVKFIVMNTKCSNDIQEEIVPEVMKVAEKYTVKGVVACMTENYLLYANNQDADGLEFLHAIQPNTPFAFGGCLVEETANTEEDLVGIINSINKGKEYISGNVMSLGLFVTPKVEEGSTSTSEELCHNFEINSFILESSEWSRPNIKQAMQEFSESVPRYEHSVALKFSCVGRLHKHEAEQHCFRDYFPHTPLVGCFGDGELGVNHPPRAPKASRNNKRPRKDPMYKKVHSYSTVFFYIGWGKLLEPAKRDY